MLQNYPRKIEEDTKVRLWNC